MIMTDKEFIERLENHPELKARFKEILTIAHNSGEKLITLADEAEMRVIEQMQKLGKETLNGWAETEMHRISKNVQHYKAGANKHTKKNSGGTAPTEQ